MRGLAQHHADILERIGGGHSNSAIWPRGRITESYIAAAPPIIGGVHFEDGTQLFQRTARIGDRSAADYASNIEYFGKQRAPHHTFSQ
jgi:hypothetical protein